MPRRMPGWYGPASLQSSKYLPVTLFKSGEAASSAEVAAPCSIVFQETSVLVESKDVGLLAMSPMCRLRFVLVIRPGLRAFTAIPGQRLAASTANRMFAVFDWA